MKEAILKALHDFGQQGAGKIAEVIGEDAESVRVFLDELTADGKAIKCGRHMWKSAAGAFAHMSKDGKPEFGKPAQSATDHIPDAGKMIPEPQQQPQRSLSEVLNAMEARLRATPPTCRAIDVKLTVLKRLASCSEEPVRAILSEICDDLEAMNRHV